MLKKISSSGLRWIWIAVLAFILDRVSKYLALIYLTPYDPYSIAPFFNLTLAYNKGAAFSFLDHVSGWQTWLFGCLAAVVSIIILVKLTQISHRQRWLSIALALVIGGALGNLFDRIYYGYVIDFIDLYASHWHWPVFNIADSAICIGAVMLFMDVMFFRKN